MTDSQKWVWLITGPNGAGKTSIRRYLPQSITQLPFLNLDAYAANAEIPQTGDDDEHTMNRYLAGGDTMMEDFSRLLAWGSSFSVESTVPYNVLGHSFAQMQAQGWKIGVIAVGAATPALCQERVDARVRNGGHNAKRADITWSKCKKLTAAVLKLADKCMVYDNSTEAPLLIASKDQKFAPIQIHHAPPNDYLKGIMTGLAENRTAAK